VNDSTMEIVSDNRLRGHLSSSSGYSGAPSSSDSLDSLHPTTAPAPAITTLKTTNTTDNICTSASSRSAARVKRATVSFERSIVGRSDREKVSDRSSHDNRHQERTVLRTPLPGSFVRTIFPSAMLLGQYLRGLL